MYPLRSIFFGILALGATPLFINGLWADQPYIVSQGPIGAYACGPCAIYNALSFGDPAHAAMLKKLPGGYPQEQVRSFIAEYGKAPSLPYGGRRPRFVPNAGIPPEDMVAALNDYLAANALPPVTGDYLDLQKGESGPHQLARVHALFARSLAAGLPAILELKTYVATPAKEDDEESKWTPLDGHYVAVVGVEEPLSPDATSFSMRVADSVNGRVLETYVSAELYRPFGATRELSIAADGKKTWRSLTGYPYLLFTSPDLPLGSDGAPWHDRAVSTVRYAIYTQTQREGRLPLESLKGINSDQAKP